ncbi:MFS transporter permease [Brevundimonas goettingensis]|jgi:mercuric ion transport protein|uniref:MFS transporter permease n=1 Tax=Brevundimonas goettingensis TaxID=2774190 RepID=A0A975GW21_9CAUL|nr:MFS transporter permease [Brevundimonas goettingensis]QTC92141.1 MFS transporter permease [Brevundimonas goettingensis]
MAIDQDRPRIPEVAVSASAAIGGVAAVFAWAACCVLPLALSVAGVSFAGAAVIAGARNWLTLVAAVILVAGWLLHWRRLRMCRKDAACRRPSRLAFWLLVIASLLIVLSLAWQPYIEPWAMPRLAAMR